MERSQKKFNESVDVVTLMRTQKRLRILENVFFNTQQRVLSRLTKWNYLRPDESTSEDYEYPTPKHIAKLLDYEIKEPIDLKLLEFTGRKLTRTNFSSQN